MNLCFICNNPIGGFKSSMYGMFSSLLKQSHSITLVIIKKNNLDLHLNDLDKRINVKKIVIHSMGESKINLLHLYFPSIFFYFLMCLLNIFIKKYDFNKKISLYSHQLHQKFYCKYCKDKINLFNYDCVISWEEVLCNYFLSKNINAKKKIGLIHPNYKNAGFSKFIDKPFLKSLDKIILTSKANEKSFLSCFPSFQNKTSSVYNLLDTDKINSLLKIVPKDLYKKSLFDIITVCRLDNSSKALDRALLIIKKLKAENYSFRWYFVGDGPYKKTMQLFIKENNLTSNVFLYGYKNNPYPYIKHADLFVLQSYYEGYPMSVLESMYIGIPPMVTSFASSNELINDNVTGFVVNNSFSCIYNELKFLIDNKNKLNNIRNNLLKLDRNIFSDSTNFIKACIK